MLFPSFLFGGTFFKGKMQRKILQCKNSINDSTRYEPQTMQKLGKSGIYQIRQLWNVKQKVWFIKTKVYLKRAEETICKVWFTCNIKSTKERLCNVQAICNAETAAS